MLYNMWKSGTTVITSYRLLKKSLTFIISQIYYWRDSSQLRWLWVSRAMKSKSFPNNDPEPSGVVTDLIPYSNYKMYIVVANNRYEGPPSNNIFFSTPEGGEKSHQFHRRYKSHMHVYQLPPVFFSVVPSVPSSFRIQQRHLDSIFVDWDVPAEPNGVITGYSLKYQTGTPTHHLRLTYLLSRCNVVLLRAQKKTLITAAEAVPCPCST